MHMQKITVEGHVNQKLEWKQTSEQTDGRTEAIALSPVLTRSVKTSSCQRQ